MPAAATAPHARSPAELPAVARRLGYGGLLPFVAGALLVWVVHDDVRTDAARVLAAYAALVCSFLGGVAWGLALRQPQPAAPLLVWGTVPPLVAWPAVLMAPGAGLVVLGGLLVACYLVDRRIYRAEGVAHWLMLRFRLTAVAAFSCFIGAAGA